MISFPIFERLEISDYGLYPGTTQKPGVQIDFKPGLTLILGANGLGKTTLVTILYRMLAGGWELSKSTLASVELGGASLEVFRMNAEDRALFANRVQDVAANATATLHLTIGTKKLVIRRRLDNLGLISLDVDQEAPVTDEDEYLAKLPALSGVPNFGDWILLLRNMVFYFEDRRSLVWDASAQRQMLRMIFLPAQEAQDWYSREREILKLDSQYRNDTAALNRLRKRVATDDKAKGDIDSLRSRLASLVPMQEKDEADLLEILEEADSLDRLRHSLRRDLLNAELNTDSSRRELEAEKLLLLQRYFPSHQDTARYLYSLLIAQKKCAVCGKDADHVVDELSTRINNICCVVCGSQFVDVPDDISVVPMDKEKVKNLRRKLEADQERVAGLAINLKDASDKYNDIAERLIKLRVDIDARAQQIATLENALPPDESKQAQAREELSALSKKLAEDRARLTSLANSFVQLVETANEKILSRSDEIKAAFAELADGFLFEETTLKWSPHRTSVGQLQLAKVLFPAFELDMSGTNFTAPTRRKGPEAVSESQREFIDLAFRMALIHVASDSIGGTLVIDAPESSLDAVFVKRAANVLCRFSSSDPENRLVVASNLIDGQLLPEMIKKGITREDKGQRLVNLMEIAVPTAALRENAADYAEELEKILALGDIQ